MAQNYARPYRPLNIPVYDPFFRPVPAPDQEPDDPNHICVSFNEEWLPVVLGALFSLAYSDRWQGDAATRELATKRAYNLIDIFANAQICVNEENMRLRQSSIDPCILEISYNNGATWETAFNYRLCWQGFADEINTGQYIETYRQYQEHRAIVESTYDGTPGSLANDAVNDVTPSANLHNALCLATTLLVSSLAELGIQIKEEANRQENNTINRIALGFGIAALVLTAFVFPPGAALAGTALATYSTFGIGMAGAALTLSTSFNNADIGIFQDQAVKDDLVCYLNTGWNDTVPTETQFKNALNNHTLTGDAGELADIASELMQDLAVYQEFLMMVEAGYDESATVALPDCPCDTWSYTWDFIQSAHSTDWQIVQAAWIRNDLPTGQYIAGVGFQTQTDPGDDSGYGVIQLIPLAEATTITRISVTGRTLSGGAGNGIFYDDSNDTVGSYSNFGTDGQSKTLHIDIDLTTTQLSVLLQSVLGNTVIEAITLEGTGENPFVS